ncbi:O-antigen polymerase [Faecalibacillus intestinalis]
MKIILINIILIIFMVFLYKYLKKKTNTYFSPLLLFNWIWITVIVNSALISTKKFSMTTNIFVILIFISGNLFFLMFSKRNNNDDLYKQIHKYYSTNKSKMKKMIIFCLLFRIMQIFYDIYVVNRLGASINMLFGNVEWLRFAYLNYSNNIGIVFALITNILNYFAELGLIISAFLCFCEKKYFYLLINIILSFFHAIFTLSKMAFFIDLIFVIGIFFIFSNIIKINRKEKRLIVLVIVFIILSLIVTGTQRGYQNQDSSIEGI